jgi:hypothetical protein
MNVTVGSDQDENGQDLGVYSIAVDGPKDGVGVPPPTAVTLGVGILTHTVLDSLIHSVYSVVTYCQW